MFEKRFLIVIVLPGLLGDDLSCEITGVLVTEGPYIACTSTFYTDGAPTSSSK